MVFFINYIILLVSAACLNSAIWSLIAIPVFAVAMIVLCRYFLRISSTREDYGMVSTLLILAGCLGLGIVIFQTSIFVSTMLIYPRSYSGNFYPDGRMTSAYLLLSDVVVSWLITTGVRMRSGLGGNHLLKFFSLSFAIPILVAALVKIFLILGVPFSA